MDAVSRTATQLLAGAGVGATVALLLDGAADGALLSGQAAMATAVVVLLMGNRRPARRTWFGPPGTQD